MLTLFIISLLVEALIVSLVMLLVLELLILDPTVWTFVSRSLDIRFIHTCWPTFYKAKIHYLKYFYQITLFITRAIC